MLPSSIVQEWSITFVLEFSFSCAFFCLWLKICRTLRSQSFTSLPLLLFKLQVTKLQLGHRAFVPSWRKTLA